MENTVDLTPEKLWDLVFENLKEKQCIQIYRHLCIFRRKLDSDSGRKWTPIPGQTGH